MKIYEYIMRIKDQASDKLRRFSNNANTANQNARRFGTQVGNVNRNISTMGSLASMAARWIGPAALGAALSFSTLKASSLAREFEQTNIAFEVMLGSASEATKMVGELTEVAAKTPFTRRDLMQGAKLLLNFGVASEKILPSLKMLGDISGGNSERFYHLNLAFAQVSAAGRLMGQDLLQMVNAGFNPLQTISQKTGISMGVLKKKMEQGAISFKMVEAAFKMATEEGGKFFGMMDRQSATFEGRLSTLRDNIEIYAGGIGKNINDFLSPILDTAIQKLEVIIDKGAGLRDQNERQLLQVRKLNTEYKPLLETYSQLAFKENRTAKESQELISAFNKLKKEFPGIGLEGGIFDAKESIRFKNDAFFNENKNRLKELAAELNKVNADLGLNKTIANNPTTLLGREFQENQQKKALSKIVELENKRADLNDKIWEIKKSIAKINDPVIEEARSKTGVEAFADLNKEGKGKGKKDKTIDRITGGGKQHVNVTINLENLIGTQNFDVKNLRETVRDMEKEVVEGLLRVLNSANYAASQ